MQPVEAGIPVVAGFVFQANFHHAIGPGIGERVDQDCVNHAEDGASSADAESEGEDCGQDEAGAFAEFARGILEVGD